MNFGSEHYVPLLKTKTAEKRALLQISRKFHRHITPFFEIVVRNQEKSPTLDVHLNKVFSNLAICAHPFGRCFLDAREIEPDGPEAAVEAFRRAVDLGLKFTPVTGVNRTVDIAAVLQHRSRGIALRVSVDEFEGGNLARDIERFMTSQALNYEHVDLIVDLGPVDEMIVPGVTGLTEAFLSEIPEIQRWRTLTVSACAFPFSMSKFDSNSHAMVERVEWNAWTANRRVLPRQPAYSDCGIQRPEGVEGFDGKTMQASAVIRYALAEEWLLIKGHGTKKTLPSVQFPQLATQLVYGHLRSHFAGYYHCAGCVLIHNAAAGAEGLGSPAVWRQLGTIHHIETVMNGLQLSPSDGPAPLLRSPAY